MLWEAVYADGWANLRSACRKPEVVWRLTKPKNLRCVDWLKLVLWSSGRRPTLETSVDNPICKYGTQFFNPNLLIGIEKRPLNHAWVRFVAKKENLWGSGRLHAVLFTSLCHVLMRKLKLENSISWYGRPFI